MTQSYTDVRATCFGLVGPSLGTFYSYIYMATENCYHSLKIIVATFNCSRNKVRTITKLCVSTNIELPHEIIVQTGRRAFYARFT